MRGDTASVRNILALLRKAAVRLGTINWKTSTLEDALDCLQDVCELLGEALDEAEDENGQEYVQDRLPGID